MSDVVRLMSSALSDVKIEDLPQDTYRILVVVYKLAEGRTDVDVCEDDICEEIKKNDILSMTDEEFAAYRKTVLGKILN